MSLTVTLPYPISSNRLWRHQGGRHFVSPEARQWKAHAAMQARLAGGRVIADADVAIDVTLHPRLTSKGEASRARIDLDNAIKAAVDAMQGIAYTNDRQVIRLAATVGDAMPDGGLTVRVERA